MENNASSNKRAVIFANGEIKNDRAAMAVLRRDDYLIAADGGLNHLRRFGMNPAVLIGDLDSVSPGDLPALEAAGITIRRFPVDKNETDLELALDLAIQKGYRRICIVGALGGRFDQSLGNLCLLTSPALDTLDVRLEDGLEEVIVIHSQAIIAGRAGDTVSLLPWGEPVIGITTHRLRYPLNHDTLYPDRTRGISNVMLGETAEIHIESGMLICVHTHS